MKSDLAKQLEDRFRRYKELSASGAWTSAVIRLAEIFHCASRLPKAESALWTARLRDEKLPTGALGQVEAGIEGDIRRLRKILSIGNRWTAEEILLIVQTRIEMELLFAFLPGQFSSTDIASLDDLDETIVALSKSKVHRRDFNWARDKMRRNWGLPIDSKWLKDPF